MIMTFNNFVELRSCYLIVSILSKDGLIDLYYTLLHRMLHVIILLKINEVYCSI